MAIGAAHLDSGGRLTAALELVEWAGALARSAGRHDLQARVLARRGKREEAERLVREAIERRPGGARGAVGGDHLRRRVEQPLAPDVFEHMSHGAGL